MQDLLYFPFRPAEKIVGVWTAMEKVDKRNGSLYVVPGSHRGVLLQHGTVNILILAMLFLKYFFKLKC